MNINDYKDTNGNVEVSETLVSDLIGGINGVVESGSNENGRWVRFADGTQICWHLTTRDNVAMTEAYGTGLFRETITTTWTHPASFVDISSALISGHHNAPYSYINDFYLTAINYRCATVSSTTRNGVVLTFYTIGRWK